MVQEAHLECKIHLNLKKSLFSNIFNIVAQALMKLFTKYNKQGINESPPPPPSCQLNLRGEAK